MRGKRVLIAPLDWGLGHATRCVPIIHALLDNGSDVVLAGSGQSLNFLKNEFPQLKSVLLPGYNPVYPHSGSMMLTLAKQSLKFLDVVKKEHRVLQQILRDNQIDLIISDNRYGCYSSKVPCVLITHQLTLQAGSGWGWLGLLANAVTRRYVRKFTQCWVPDFPGSKLSGQLSETHDKHVVFIGPLSHLKKPNEMPTKKYDVVALISGPEPQREIFETLVTQQLIESKLHALIIRGVVENKTKAINDNITVVDYLKSDELAMVILESEIVLARSGYSTIMDIAHLGKKGIFIPTPGQTEQEYLALRFMEMGIAFTMDQHSFSLQAALTASKKYTGFEPATFNTDFILNLTQLLHKP